MNFNYLTPNGGYYPYVWMIPTPYFHPPNNIECKEEEEKNMNKTQKSLDLPQENRQNFQLKIEEGLKTPDEENMKKKRRRNLKKFKENEEYVPEDQMKNTKEKGKQNMLRNILPNIMHQTCTFVQKKSRSESSVRKLLEKFDLPYGTVDRFYLYQRLIKQKNNHYINEDALEEYITIHEQKCQIFTLEEQKLYLQLSRVLIKHFLFNDVRINVLTSNRMKTQTKNGHLKVLRRVINSLETAYKQ